MAPVAEGVDQVTSSSGADGSRDEAKMQTMRQQEDEEGGGKGREWNGIVLGMRGVLSILLELDIKVSVSYLVCGIKSVCYLRVY